MFTSLLKDVIKDADECQDEATHKAKSRRSLSTGVSFPEESGCITFLVYGCVHPLQSSLNPQILEFL